MAPRSSATARPRGKVSSQVASTPIAKMKDSGLTTSVEEHEDPLGSCVQCSLECKRLQHKVGKFDVQRQGRHPPCFSKLVSERPPCYRMTLPPPFAEKYMPVGTLTAMVLENSNGGQWTVMYQPTHGFQSGWNSFSNANGVDVGDMLFFALVETNKFVVQVFDSLGCEKHQPGSTPPAKAPSSFRPPDEIGCARFRSMDEIMGDQSGGDGTAIDTDATRSDEDVRRRSGKDDVQSRSVPPAAQGATGRKLGSSSVAAAFGYIPDPWNDLLAASWDDSSDEDTEPGLFEKDETKHANEDKKTVVTRGPTSSKMRPKAVIRKKKHFKPTIADLLREDISDITGSRDTSYIRNPLKRNHSTSHTATPRSAPGVDHRPEPVPPSSSYENERLRYWFKELKV